jgi:hypothetical protein
MDQLFVSVRDRHHIAGEPPKGVYNGVKLCDEVDLSIPLSVETDLV